MAEPKQGDFIVLYNPKADGKLASCTKQITLHLKDVDAMGDSLIRKHGSDMFSRILKAVQTEPKL